MKKLLFTLLIGITSLAYSQAPQQISYQGVARNASGTVLANQPIGIRFDIHQGSASGAVVFTETHTGVSTNGFGLFTTYIGSISNLAVVNWATNSYFIEVWIDPNTGTYSSLGSQQLMSVPYALNAGSAPAPTVSFTNNILSVGGNTTTISAITPTLNINSPNTVTNPSAGVYSITVPSSTPYTLTANSNTLTIDNGASISTATVPVASLYTLTATSNSITLNNGASVSTVTVPVASLYTLTANSNTITLDNGITVTTATVPAYSAGAGISISSIGVITNTASSTALPNAYQGQLLYNKSGVWDTIPSQQVYYDDVNIKLGIGTNNPQANLHVVGDGKFNSSVTTNQIYTNNFQMTATTPNGKVLTSDGLGNGTWQALPTPSLSYNNTNNILTLTQGTVTTSDTLTGTGSSTISMTSTGIASVSPTSGSAFTVSVASPTFTPNGPTTITGTYPNLTINSTASPSTSLVAGNLNLTLFPSGNTYTLDVKSYSLTANSNTLTLSNGASITTATVPSSPIYSGTPNNISITSNTINLVASGVTTNNYGANATNAVPTFSVDNFGRLTTASQYTPNVAGDVIGSINTSTVSKLRGVNISTVAPTANQVLQFNAGSWTPSSIASPTITGTGTGIATVTTSATNFTVNVPAPTYTASTGVLSFGGTNVVVTPTLSLTGTTLTSGPSTNSVNLATLPGLWTAPTATSVVTTNSISLVGIGTNTPSYKLDVYANGSVPATIHGYNSGATASSTGVFGENPNNGIGVFGQSNSGKGVWGSSTSDAGLYGESVAGDGGKFILSSNTTTANAVNAQTNGSGAALYAKSYNANPLAAKFDGNTIINHTSTSALPHVTLVSPTISDFGRFKFLNTGSVNYFTLEGRNNTGGVNDAFDISHYNGVNEKQIFLINGSRNVFINNLNLPLTTFHVMTSTATASGGIASEGFGQSGQLNLTRNNNAGAGVRTSVVGGDELGKLNFSGYDGSTFGDGAKIYAKTTENVTGSNKGTELIFAAVPTGTNSNKDAFKINGAGKLEVITSMIIPFGSAAGKVLTSDPLGNASWQTITAPASPWIQGSGIVTQSVTTDNVGIGTNTPQSSLHIANAGGSQLRLGNNNQPTLEWMWDVDAVSNLSLVNENNGTALTRMFMDVNTGNLGLGTNTPNASLDIKNNAASLDGLALDLTNTSNGSNGLQLRHFGTGNAAYIEVNNSSSSARVLDVTSNGTGIGIRAEITNTLSTSGLFNATHYGRGNAGFFQIINANNPAKAVEAITNGSGVTIGAANSGTGGAGDFSVSNSGNTSSALQASSNGSGSSIASYNSGTGNAGYFIVNNASSTATGIQVTTTGTGNALNANANTGTAINAVSTGAVATELIFNNGSGDGLQIFTGSGRGINATNTSNIVAAAQFYNDGTSNSLLATKNSTTTGGNVARFENNSTTNPADAEYVKTLGAGAAIHAVNGPTVTGGTNAALWLESGHIKVTASAVPGVSIPTNSLGGFTATPTITATSNDVKGTVTITSNLTGVAANGYVDVNVAFNKLYSTGTTVWLTPVEPSKFSYVIISQTSSNFVVRIINNTSLSLPFASGFNYFRFNYFVVE